MVSALNSQAVDNRYPEDEEYKIPNISLLRKQGKISDPEDAFFIYLSGRLHTPIVQQFVVPAYDRKTYNKFYWHLDIYLPKHRLAIEINGQKHYTDPKQFVSDHWKQIDCTRIGIALVSFPCFPPKAKTLYDPWTYKMFKYWHKDIERLIDSFSWEK